MRKKLLAVLATATMVLAMNLSVFAAGSPTTDDTSDVKKPDSQKAEINVEDMVTDTPTSYVDKLTDTKATVNGEPIGTVIIEAVSDTTMEATVAEIKQQLNDIASVAKQIGSDELEKAATDETKTVKPEVVVVAEVKAPEGVEVSEENPITITFPVEGIKAGANVMVLHWKGNSWELIKPDKVNDGEVIVTFTSLSPIAIIEVEVDEKSTGNGAAPAPAPTATPAPSDNAGVTAPKTGEPVSALVVLTLMSAAGIGICGKKIKEK